MKGGHNLIMTLFNMIWYCAHYGIGDGIQWTIKIVRLLWVLVNCAYHKEAILYKYHCHDLRLSVKEATGYFQPMCYTGCLHMLSKLCMQLVVLRGLFSFCFLIFLINAHNALSAPITRFFFRFYMVFLDTEIITVQYQYQRTYRGI